VSTHLRIFISYSRDDKQWVYELASAPDKVYRGLVGPVDHQPEVVGRI
jgi:hypothetical protein